MLKEKAVESLGQQSLLMPAWIKAALAANDRLKLYLSLLQSVASHADAVHSSAPDWGHELAQAGLRDADWLRSLVKSAYVDEGVLLAPELGQLLEALADDLCMMARPLAEGGPHADLLARRDVWVEKLHEMKGEDGLSRDALDLLTQGDRKVGDSFHILVMDIHKQLNIMAHDIATENIDGAHVWQIADDDRPLIAAFMHGLNRTAPLKFSHPGLDTAVTRADNRLLIQNDIGTNDVHVLVIEVEKLSVRLTYSDLHAGRFNFFRQMLEGIGFRWSVFEPITADGLNAGKPYQVGKALLNADNLDMLKDRLEATASRIVFVIDWNRARKRLQNFVSKSLALTLLRQAADESYGHMAWLLVGGERLVYDAMQAVDNEAFRVGDRLDMVLGEAPAFEFLRDLMRLASTLLRQQQPISLIADEARMRLARVLRQATFEFNLLAEHAAYCHALATGLCEALESGAATDAESRSRLTARAKNWERQADHVLMDARQRAERQSRWQPIVTLLEQSDDVADAIEEAIFIYTLSCTPPLRALPAPVMAILCQLADTTLAAIQDQVRAIETARHISDRNDALDSESFLQALWHMLRAERRCDELARHARITIIQNLHDAPASLQLANDLANTIERASDGLLAAGYTLRQIVLTKTGRSS